MSDPIDTGGPAFPHTRVYCDSANDLMDAACRKSGMTLRDWFAGQALPSLVRLRANSAQAEQEMRKLGLVEGQFDRLCAKCAYDYADALLAARKETR